jgi:RNA polymerase sigma factor (sigma-70 family)
MLVFRHVVFVKDCRDRAFRFTCTAIDAWLRVDVKHLVALPKTIRRANDHAVSVFAAKTGLCHNKGHVEFLIEVFSRLSLSETLAQASKQTSIPFSCWGARLGETRPRVHAENGLEVDTHSSDSCANQSAESIALFVRFVDGDMQAADVLFHRYAERLIALARSRLSAKLAARVAPDDIVMSAYRSFFINAREGQFDISQPGAVWRLLVQITLHKLYRQVKHHQAERRAVGREVTGGTEQVQQFLSQEPSPEAAAELVDEVEKWLSRLSPDQRQAVELRWQGADISEIAQRLGRSTKTIRRHLEAAKRIMLGLSPDETDSRRDPPPKKSPRQKSLARTNQPLEIEGVTNLRFEDYLLQQQIGSGMTGKVYRAQNHSSGQIVAIKYLRKKFFTNPQIVDRFLDEVRTVAQLDHSGIIRIHGFGQTPGGGYFIAMDLVVHGDLTQYTRRNSSTHQDKVRWLAQAADALQYSHDRGVVHCDLKPGNLLLNADLNLIVSDFGFARQLVPVSASPSFFAGTPAFMAPEQVESRWGLISPVTDIYGLGTVLFFLLFDRPPITGTNIAGVLAASAADCPIEFPVIQLPDLPPALIQVCRDCLAKQPSQRIATMSELAVRLRSVALK